jgi:DNA-nicking Smr family endonuclease
MAKDVELFKAAMAGVKPIKGRRTSKLAASPTLPESGGGGKKTSAQISSPLMQRKMKEGVGSIAETPFDRDIDRALSRGKRSPEAKLDLHGMTLAAAERAVAQFLAVSSEQGRRVVLVVTGKGLRLEGGRVLGGRIRAEFMAWLERADNRARVTGARAAHPRHGGSGAFYVLLRRRTVRA